MMREFRMNFGERLIFLAVFCNSAQLVFVTVFNVTTVTGPSMAQVKKMTETEIRETEFLGNLNISYSFAFLSKL